MRRIAVLLLLLLASCGQLEETGSVPTTAPTAGALQATTAPAQPTSAAGGQGEGQPAGQAKQYEAMPAMSIDPSKEYVATIKTAQGDIVLRLFADQAPQTVNNFVFLARDGYYDGLTFHRVIPGFMAQGGDPTGTGAGGPGYTIPDEVTPDMSFNRPGLISMARTSAPDSAGSQFFITTGEATHLDGQFTIFGEVIEGQEVVEQITPRDPQAASAPGEVIQTITIEEQ